MSEQEIIDRYSTPGLKKHELSKAAKRQHLIEGYRWMTRDEREALLDKLYPVYASGGFISEEHIQRSLMDSPMGLIMIDKPTSFDQSGSLV